jgi:hypothetical protein
MSNTDACAIHGIGRLGMELGAAVVGGALLGAAVAMETRPQPAVVEVVQPAPVVYAPPPPPVYVPPPQPVYQPQPTVIIEERGYQPQPTVIIEERGYGYPHHHHHHRRW